MKESPLTKLEAYGQSIWIDFISRGALKSGQLKRWIDEDGVSGVTSNPSIFEKAVVESNEYDETIQTMLQAGKSPTDMYLALTVADIQAACDLLRLTFDKTNGRDGFVSIEVSPHLAHDTEGTVAEARKLWQTVNRPNVMVKIPGTREGLPAIQQCIGEGININITLLFGLPRYREVINAYLSGLEKMMQEGQTLGRLTSVASFFLSRIDTLIDPQLEKIMQGSDPQQAELARQTHGQVALASARLAYQIYTQAFQEIRFLRLEAQGARTQRLLWASTSTKNPAYPDTKYVDPLIGPDTINTLPVETLDAYRDHGEPSPRLIQNLPESRQVMENLKALGIDIDKVTQQLEDEGVEKFNKAYDQLIDRLKEKQKVLAGNGAQQ
jgi:transaldolase